MNYWYMPFFNMAYMNDYIKFSSSQVNHSTSAIDIIKELNMMVNPHEYSFCITGSLCGKQPEHIKTWTNWLILQVTFSNAFFLLNILEFSSNFNKIDFRGLVDDNIIWGHQAITRITVDQDLCGHMSSLSQNELN